MRAAAPLPLLNYIYLEVCSLPPELGEAGRTPKVIIGRECGPTVYR
jgi:hypothetical protein